MRPKTFPKWTRARLRSGRLQTIPALTRKNQVQASHQQNEGGKRKRGRELVERAIDVRSELYNGLARCKAHHAALGSQESYRTHC
jgi:hypothetical protein